MLIRGEVRATATVFNFVGVVFSSRDERASEIDSHVFGDPLFFVGSRFDSVNVPRITHSATRILKLYS